MDIGILHPGEMGAAIAMTLNAGGHQTLWLPDGRSAETARRAADAGIRTISSLDEMVRRCGIVLSICPPHAAVDVARQLVAASEHFGGIYLDSNAISPTSAAVVSSLITNWGARYVDGGIVGTPPPRGHPRWYLSGTGAAEVAELFTKVPLEIIVLGESPTAASALKMAYASWTKGTAALLLNIRALARYHGVDQELVAEWERTQSELIDRCDQAAMSAMRKGWRWNGEMDEITATFADIGLPDGFGRAAAEIYRRVPRQVPTRDNRDLERVVENLRG